MYSVADVREVEVGLVPKESDVPASILVATAEVVDGRKHGLEVFVAEESRGALPADGEAPAVGDIDAELDSGVVLEVSEEEPRRHRDAEAFTTGDALDAYEVPIRRLSSASSPAVVRTVASAPQ